MTRDEIIELAREAGLRAGHIELFNSDPLPFVAPCSATDCLPEVERFAALVAAAEREACAKLCDAEGREWDSDDVVTQKNYAAHCAATIRARGNQ